MKQEQQIQQIVMGIKIFFFLFILTTPFIPAYYLKAINNIFLKIVFLVAIILAAFYDISLAILMTITFLILTIVANKDKLMKIKSESFSTPEIIYKSAEMKEIVTPQFFETVVKMPKTQCNDMRYYKDQISNDIYDIYIDEKIKPYQEYVRKLTSPSRLDIAQTNELF